MSIKTQTSLAALAQAVDCDTAETVRWEIAETLDKCAGTKERLLEQIRNDEDCDTCPPGFLAVVMQAENLARALGIALDLLGVPTIDGTETEGEPSMPSVNGKRFACAVCEVNVFTRRGGLYTCNGCGAQYQGS